MKNLLALLALTISAHSFASTEATAVLLSLLNGTYHGYDCEVKVLPTNNGVSVEMFKDNLHMEYFVAQGSQFNYRPYGRFVSSFRHKQSTTDYIEYSFMTTPTNFGQYAAIEKRVVKNRVTKVTKIECEIID